MSLSRRSYTCATRADTWKEIWEAGPYYERISELLEQAQEYAIFVGWQVDSRLSLPRGAAREPLKQKLLRLCEEKPGLQIYFLVWSHAYLYVIEREVWQTRIWEEIHPRIHFVFDNRHPFGGSHHEKLCLIDGQVAFCGGIDLCDERWDSPQHLYRDPRRSLDGKEERHGPYHDLAVEVSGPVCAAIHSHVARRWTRLTRIPFPLPRTPARHGGENASGYPVFVSRTVADVNAGVEKTPLVREIEFLYRDLIFCAEKRLILEGQYYWSGPVQDLLITKMHRMRGRDFEIVLILAELRQVRSFTRRMAGYEMKLVERLLATARFTGTRITIATPHVFASGAPPRPVYIHSKILIADDRYLCIGSANLATRALRLDTEINLTLDGSTPEVREHIRRFADDLVRHWTPASRELELRPTSPRIALTHRRGRVQLPWQRIFDPEISWSYRVKRELRMLNRRHPMLQPSLIAAGVCVMTTLVSWMLSWTLPGTTPLALLFTIYLISAWALPFPWCAGALLAAFRLGPDTAIPLIYASYTAAALSGYLFGRILPGEAERWLDGAPDGAPHDAASHRIGLRSFRALVLALLDPRTGLRTKILVQGLHYVPFPWFCLLNGLILPSLLSVACAELADLSPPSMVSWINAHLWECLLLCLLAALLPRRSVAIRKAEESPA